MNNNKISNSQTLTLGFPHPPPPIGGPGTFQKLLSSNISRYGVRIVDSNYRWPDAVLVVSGTKRILWLWRCRKKGVRIVQRLDGINWRELLPPHNFKKRLIGRIRNQQLRFIRNYLVDAVIYQSKFIKDWWHRIYGQASCDEHIVCNGTKLDIMNRTKLHHNKKPVLLCVEGVVQPGTGAIDLIEVISKYLVPDELQKIIIVGHINADQKVRLQKHSGIDIRGKVKRELMPQIYREADIFLCLEINPPCPNSVIEAMASGLPIVGYDTGSLHELAPGITSELVKYNGDPWNLDLQCPKGIVKGLKLMINRLDKASNKARIHAETYFSEKVMTSKYADILFK